MVKLVTFLALAFTARISAIPTILIEKTSNNAELVPSCRCGNLTGSFCGERASAEDQYKPISGTCNATSLYYCSEWAAKTGGIADVVQAPCWTENCHQVQPHNDTGMDTCGSVKVEREDFVAETSPTPAAHCTCGSSTGHFCGERASIKGGENNTISGNCTTNNLYYCSLWAVKTGGLADAVQSPCWDKICYQSTELGYDDCNLPRAGVTIAMRTELAAAMREGLDAKLQLPPWPMASNCSCKAPGYLCGNRDTYSTELSGDCGGNHLLFCSVESALSGGQALIADNQCNDPHYCKWHMTNGAFADYCSM